MSDPTPKGSDAQVPRGRFIDRFLTTQIWDGVQMLTKRQTWTTGRKEELNSPIFRAHPAWDLVFVSDNDSAVDLLNRPADEVDRPDGFANVNFDTENLMFGVKTHLQRRNEIEADEHTKLRSFWFKMIEARGMDRFAEICQDVMDNGLERHRGKEKLDMVDALCEVCNHVVCRWLVGIDGFESKETQEWVVGLGYTRGDTFMSNFIMSKIKPRLGPEGTAMSKRMVDKIRAGPLYPSAVEIALEVGLKEEDVGPIILAPILTNAVTPYATMKAALAHAYMNPELRARLEAEVRDVTDVHELLNLPLLDAFFYEGVRLYGRPTFAVRIARKDIELTSNEGKRFAISAGTTMCVIYSIVRTDTKYFKDPMDFIPDRFLDDPHLHERLLSFAGADTKDLLTSFYCPAARGNFAKLYAKISAYMFLKDPDGKIETPYKMDINSESGTAPVELKWVCGTK